MIQLHKVELISCCCYSEYDLLFPLFIVDGFKYDPNQRITGFRAFAKLMEILLGDCQDICIAMAIMVESEIIPEMNESNSVTKFPALNKSWFTSLSPTLIKAHTTAHDKVYFLFYGS